MARASSPRLPGFHPADVSLFVFIALALVMLITRTHSLSQVVHLPDTSLASFFIAGFYIRSRLAMPALFALGFAIDVVMITVMGTSGFCFTLAYAMLLPAYGLLWAAGRLAAARLGGSLPMIAGLLAVAVLGSEMLSSGGFYFLSGRFAEPTLAGFLPRLLRYFPLTLISALGWGAVAAMAHGLALLIGARRLSAEQR
jgi:hypothetical protein